MTNNRDEPAEPVLGQLQPFAWSDEQSTSYEAAIELIGQVVAGYEALIDREQTKSAPDADAIKQWNAAEDHYIAQRDALRLTDGAEIQRLRDECTEAIRKIQAAL